MKYSFFALFAMTSAVMVTQTDFNTFYVTVDGDAPAATSSSPAPAPAAPTTTGGAEPSSEAPAPTSSEAPAVPNYDYVETTTSSDSSSYVAPAPSSSSPSSSAPAPAPTTSSSSSTYVAPTTSSSSSVPPPPPTTSSSTPVTTTSSSTSSSASSTPTSSGFESEVVDYHNKVRSIHQVGSMSWNGKLADFAQNYLDHSNCKFAHSGGPYGENIAIGYKTIEDALDAWYNEENEYNYSAGQFSEATGHFTQMVWKGSDEVGCAKIDCSGRTYIACEYTPRGNIIGKFTENVFPPKN